MLTQDSITVLQYLIEEDRCDPELAVTVVRPSLHGDGWPAVTARVVIIAPCNVTRPCDAMRWCLPSGASGRGGNGEPPRVCVSSPQPDGEARRIRSKLDQLLKVLDKPGLSQQQSSSEGGAAWQ